MSLKYLFTDKIEPKKSFIVGNDWYNHNDSLFKVNYNDFIGVNNNLWQAREYLKINKTGEVNYIGSLLGSDISTGINNTIIPTYDINEESWSDYIPSLNNIVNGKDNFLMNNSIYYIEDYLEETLEDGTIKTNIKIKTTYNDFVNKLSNSLNKEIFFIQNRNTHKLIKNIIENISAKNIENSNNKIVTITVNGKVPKVFNFCFINYNFHYLNKYTEKNNNSFINGTWNNISGFSNFIFGLNNINHGNFNFIFGDSNLVTKNIFSNNNNNSYIFGNNNNINEDFSKILSSYQKYYIGNNFIIGNNHNIKSSGKNFILGASNILEYGISSIVSGEENYSNGECSATIGRSNYNATRSTEIKIEGYAKDENNNIIGNKLIFSKPDILSMPKFPIIYFYDDFYYGDLDNFYPQEIESIDNENKIITLKNNIFEELSGNCFQFGLIKNNKGSNYFDSSIILGYTNLNTGLYNTIIGQNNHLNGKNNLALGIGHLSNNGKEQIILGRYAEGNEDDLLVIGNGKIDKRKNIIEIKNDNNIILKEGNLLGEDKQDNIYKGINLFNSSNNILSSNGTSIVNKDDSNLFIFSILKDYFSSQLILNEDNSKTLICYIEPNLSINNNFFTAEDFIDSVNINTEFLYGINSNFIEYLKFKILNIELNPTNNYNISNFLKVTLKIEEASTFNTLNSTFYYEPKYFFYYNGGFNENKTKTNNYSIGKNKIIGKNNISLINNNIIGDNNFTQSATNQIFGNYNISSGTNNLIMGNNFNILGSNNNVFSGYYYSPIKYYQLESDEYYYKSLEMPPAKATDYKDSIIIIPINPINKRLENIYEVVNIETREVLENGNIKITLTKPIPRLTEENGEELIQEYLIKTNAKLYNNRSDSTILGRYNSCTGFLNFVIGSYNHSYNSTANNNILLGINNLNYGNNNILLGQGNKTIYNNQIILGKYAEGNEDDLLTIGNGTEEERSNAFSIKENGDTYINGNLELSNEKYLNSFYSKGNLNLTKYTTHNIKNISLANQTNLYLFNISNSYGGSNLTTDSEGKQIINFYIENDIDNSSLLKYNDFIVGSYIYGLNLNNYDQFKFEILSAEEVTSHPNVIHLQVKPEKESESYIQQYIPKIFVYFDQENLNLTSENNNNILLSNNNITTSYNNIINGSDNLVKQTNNYVAGIYNTVKSIRNIINGSYNILNSSAGIIIGNYNFNSVLSNQIIYPIENYFKTNEEITENYFDSFEITAQTATKSNIQINKNIILIPFPDKNEVYNLYGFDPTLDIIENKVISIENLENGNKKIILAKPILIMSNSSGDLISSYSFFLKRVGTSYNNILGKNNLILGSDNFIVGEENYCLGKNNIILANDAVATTNYQTILGIFNKPESDNYALLFGIGTAANERKNGFTLDWDGNAIFAGTVKSGTTELLKNDLSNVDQGSFKTKVIEVAPNTRTCRFVIGTSTSGWTSADCDYLCDGTNDNLEIQAAIDDLPTTGGEITILDGIYNLSVLISVNKENIVLKGNSASGTILNCISSNGLSISKNYIEIKNLTIKNSNTYELGYPSSGYGIRTGTNTHHLKIENIFINNYYVGIDLAYQNEVINSEISHCVNGIETRSSNNFILNNRFLDCVHSINFNGGIIKNNIINNMTDLGDYYSNSTGIKIKRGNAIVSENILYNDYIQYGIEISNSDESSDILISHNILNRALEYTDAISVLLLGNARRVRLLYNTMIGCNYANNSTATTNEFIGNKYE